MSKIRVGCAGIILHKDKVLLGIRGKEPNYGKWILPGGGVDFGELLEDTLKREIMEESNIKIKKLKYFKHYELINLPNEHRIIFYFQAEYNTGILKASSDLLDVKFLTKNEIQKLYKEEKISPFVVDVLKDFNWII